MKRTINNIQVRNGNGKAAEILQPAESLITAPPSISVIIPVYQEEKILENALSIFTDEIKNKYVIEVIVSDGGSSDKSIEIAEKYADKLVAHTEKWRQTISEGRNKGAELAEGNVLMFMNADCTPANPEQFFKFVSDWDKGSLPISGYKTLACPVGGAPEEILLKDKIFYFCHNAYVRGLNAIGLGMGRGECQLIKKEIFHRVGGYDPTIAAGEDFDLYRRIAKITKIGYAKDIKVYESPRRFRKFGYFRILASWTINAVSVMLTGKAVSKEWETVR